MKKQKKKKMGPPPVSFSSHKQTNKQKASKQAAKIPFSFFLLR
jgi:hypothetical protein